MALAQRLEEFLMQEWSTGLRLSTIPQAMQRLGMDEDQRLRWRVMQQLEALWHGALTSPEKQRGIAAALGRPLNETQAEQWRKQVASWQPASIVLGEDEKLVARHILMRQQRGLPLPRPAETAKALGLPAREVRRALRMLATVGFVSLPDPRRTAAYELADGYEKLLQGLGFSFHTVTLNTGERFGVPWAVDFLLLVSSQYKEQYITLDDACAHCIDRIRIEVGRGKLVQVDPADTIVYQGGTWGTKNLFRSEEHLKDWFGSQIPLSAISIPVVRFLAEVARISAR